MGKINVKNLQQVQVGSRDSRKDYNLMMFE